MSTNKNVKVFVRTKPVSVFPKEILQLGSDGKGIVVHISRGQNASQQSSNQPTEYGFTFDGILHEATQQAVYDSTTSNVVMGSMDGYNGTVLCYGMTSAGKTFTTTGATESFEHRGLVPRAIAHVYKEARARSDTATTTIRVSYVEIYLEQLRDLLGGDNAETTDLKICDDGGTTVIKGARIELCATEEEALRWLFEGETNRTIGEHQMNKHSSRSHTIFTLYIESRSRVESVERVVLSKLNFVDLAGSERLAKTHTTGETAKEACYINKSLTFLEQVIVALGDKQAKHVPYRQSKLTSILRDSLGGNSRTTLIANIRCEPEHAEETVATLRFASRMALINNTAVANVQYDPVELLHKCEREIKDLKAELAMHDQIAGRSHIQYDQYTEEQQAQLRARIRAYIKGDVDELDFATLRQMREIIVQFRAVVREMEKENNEKLKSAITSANAAAVSSSAPTLATGQEGGGSQSLLPSAVPLAGLPGSQISTSRRLASAGGDTKSRSALRPSRVGEEQADSQQSTQLPPLDQKGRATTPTTTTTQPIKPVGNQKSKALQETLNAGKEEESKVAADSNASQEQEAGEGRKSKSRKDKKKPQAGEKETKEREKPGRKKKHGKAAEVEAEEVAAAQEEQKGNQPNSSPQQQQTTNANDGEKQRDSDSKTTTATTTATLPPEPPKPAGKAEAFEVFKKYRGAETNAVLCENKRVLREKRKNLKDLASNVNEIKHEIDSLRSMLQLKREERMKAPDFDADAEEVIDVDEFEAMKRLKDCKKQYREKYEQVGQLKADIEYVSRSIDQCRQKILSDFEEWFGETPTTQQASSTTPANKEEQVVDFEEMFDRVQQEHQEEQRRLDPEAFAYFNAKSKAKKSQK